MQAETAVAVTEGSQSHRAVRQLMFGARPILLVLLMLAGAASLHAKEWSIGSELLGPAPGRRGKARVASNGQGSLAVWCDGRSFRDAWDVVGVRLDAEGQPMRTMMIRRGGCSWLSELLVGSNGENFVVVGPESSRGLYRAEIFPDDTVREAESLTSTIHPIHMVWNGSHFLVTSSYNHSSFTYQAILLDRHGELASGTLELREQMRYVVSDGERWMMAVPNRAWILASSDFPPLGERKTFSKDSFPVRALGLVWDGQNFVALSTDDWGQTLLLERYDRDGRNVRETASAALPVRSGSEFELAVVHDGMLELAYRASWESSSCASEYAVVRMKMDQHPRAALPEDEIGNRPLRTIRLPAVRRISTICGSLDSLFVSPAGAYAVWSATVVYDREMQIFGRLVGGSPSDVLLSAERASPRAPRLASAAGRHLVAWIERRKLDEVWFRVIDEDGNPVTPARRLSAPAASILDLAVTSDGSSFLIAWQVYLPWLQGNVHGAFVSGGGEILKEPFSITLDKFGLLGSAVWNGREHLVTFGDRVYSVTREGTVPLPNGQLIDFHEPYGHHQLSTVLARDGDAIFALAEFVDFPPFDGAPIPTWHETIILNENATGGCWSASAVDCVASPWLRWKTEGVGEFGLPSRPAFAAGNGHALLVWFENVWERDGSRLVTRIVGEEHASAGETYPYPAFPKRPHVTWTGSAFVAAMGATLQRLSPTGEPLTTTSLGDGVLESHVAVGQTGRPIVVFFREDLVPRLMVRPLDDITFGIHEHAPSARR